MEHIWKFLAPYNLKFIAWLFSQDKCWTADGLQTHGLPHPAIYPFCDQEGETLQHLLLGCMLAREVWEVVLWPWPGGPRPTLSWSVGGRQRKPVRETAQGLYGRCWLSSFGVGVGFTSTVEVPNLGKPCAILSRKSAALCPLSHLCEPPSINHVLDFHRNPWWLFHDLDFLLLNNVIERRVSLS
jgi:hypothetical protein